MMARERHKEARDVLVQFVKDRVGTPFEAPANVTGTGAGTGTGGGAGNGTGVGNGTGTAGRLSRAEAVRLKYATRDASTAMTELRKFAPRGLPECTQVSVTDPPPPPPPPPRIGEAGDAEHVLYYGEALRVAVRSIAALIVPLYDLGDHELWLRLGVPTPPVRAVVPPWRPHTSRGQ